MSSLNSVHELTCKMGFYAVSTMPLSKPDSKASLKKIVYADDGSGGGKLDGLLDW